MARIFVEPWDPAYGSPLGPDDALAPSEGSVDEDVETTDWAPIPGRDDGVERITFVDGVRRVDARLTLDEGTGVPVAGLCGTFGVGAAVWDRHASLTTVTEERVERWAVLSARSAETFPEVDLRPSYGTIATTDPDPAAPLRILHTEMRKAEAELATRLAGEGFVIADGPLSQLVPLPVVGYVKSHRVAYLGARGNAVVAALGPGERTPVFTLGGYARYSWYVRLADLPGAHAWTAVVRCEAANSLPFADVVTIADRTAAVLPVVASQPHVDPRAPQNLVPVGGLERTLRHRMGDPGLIWRRLREAVHDRTAA
jgi:hypothetical protein